MFLLLTSLMRRFQIITYKAAKRAARRLYMWVGAVWLLHVLAMMWLEGQSFNDANWLTWTTLVTVGYGDVSAKTVAGRWATIILIYWGGVFVLANAVNAMITARAEAASLKLAALHNLWIWKTDSPDLPHHFRGELWNKLSDDDKTTAVTRRRECLRHDLVTIYGVDLPVARAHTKNEAVDTLLRQLSALAHYWGTLEEPLGCEQKTPLDRCNGLVFSILSMFDGSNGGMPAMNLYPSVTDEDIAFHRAEGENWFIPNEAINDEISLHDVWHGYEFDEEGKRRNCCPLL